MAGKGNEVLDAQTLRLQHAIVYEQNTSEIKDDLQALVSIVKSGNGLLTRQEALFLVWHHALDGPESAEELITYSVVNACLSVIDSTAADVGATERTCAAGILVALCEEPDHREAVIKGRSPQGSATALLHTLLRDTRDAMRLYAARTLRLVADESSARAALLKAMEQHLSYCSLYRELIADGKDSHTVAQLAHFLTALLAGRDDLKAAAVEGGLVEACLTALKAHKVDSACSACLGLLESLSDDRSSWPRIHANGGVVLLCDYLGPPPKVIQVWEAERYKALIDPAWAAEQERARLELLRLDHEARERAAEAAADSMTGTARSLSTRSGVRGQRSMASQRSDVTDQATVGGAGAGAAAEATTTAADNGAAAAVAAQNTAEYRQKLLQILAQNTQLPAPPKKASELLSINSAGLKWNALVQLRTYSHAAGCLYQLAQDKEYMLVMSSRLAASRLVPLLIKAMEPPPEAGKKAKSKKKKKGLSLTAEQTQMLVRITGTLKFLSLVNVNRYRIAKLGAVKPLVAIYEECAHTLLRRNAQVILSNMAMLAENGQLLLDGQLPEEFLVPVPMRLTADEVEQLAVEFPDAPFVQKTGGTTGVSDSASNSGK